MSKAIVAKKVDDEVARVQQAYALELTVEAKTRLKEIKELKAYTGEQVGIAAKITITDDASDAAAAEVTVNLTKARKGLEGLRKFFTAPLEGVKKGIIAVFDEMSEEAIEQENRLRREGGAWFMKKENAKREAEAKRQADIEAANKKAAQLGRSAPKVIAPPPVEETARTVETDNGSRRYDLEWVAEFQGDLSLVPEKYITKSINKKAVDADVATGTREIPGFLIAERPKAVVR